MVEQEKDFARGNRIVQRRKELGLSQMELANIIGIARSSLSSIENGGSFNVELLPLLVSALETSYDYIMRGEAKNSKVALLEEVNSELQDTDESFIRQIIGAIRGMKSVLFINGDCRVNTTQL